MSFSTKEKSIKIKNIALDLGFSFCGISKAEFLEEEAPRFEKWLKNNFHSDMQYLEKNFDKRMDPRKLVDGARSVISLMYNYYPEKNMDSENEYKIAKYAYSKEDYHFIIKKKLTTFVERIRKEVGNMEGRTFVDSAPVHERAWAKKSGLGWIGKNSLLINKQKGSFFFLAELICDMDLEIDGPIKDYCGTCTRCMDACPTQAIPIPYMVDASRCISYFTIEMKGEMPVEMKGKFENWIFGCDICQDVCPWNRFSTKNTDPSFEYSDIFFQMKKSDWEDLTEESFNTFFKHSALKHTQFKGIKRNILFHKKLS